MLSLLLLLESAWSQQADCSFRMRFFDVDECERFNTPFVQTTIIADGTCRSSQSSQPEVPGPYYRAVCGGEDRVFFIAANCRDAACSDCDRDPWFTNNFDGAGWTEVSWCHPVPETTYSFNIQSGSCDPDKCAVPERYATPAPTTIPRSAWPTWYEPSPSPTALPVSIPIPSPVDDSSEGPSVLLPTNNAVIVIPDQPPSLPSAPQTPIMLTTQAPNTTNSPSIQSLTEPVSSSVEKRFQIGRTVAIVPLLALLLPLI